MLHARLCWCRITQKNVKKDHMQFLSRKLIDWSRQISFGVKLDVINNQLFFLLYVSEIFID